MEMTEKAAVEAPRQRRVGTFTLGVTLLAAGGLMLVSMFFPKADLNWVLKGSPIILILLGVETLTAARGGGKVKYDWAGMLLCFVLTGAALCMCAAAWYMAYWPEYGRYFSGSRTGDESSLLLDYSAFNGTEFQLLELEEGDILQADIVSRRGSIDVEIIEDEERETIFESENLATGVYSIEIPDNGSYELWVSGYQAEGRAHFQRQSTLP
ncbi:hypothetical protein [uncultured Dysosmobacter sp.]|uniref:hypothetical protein n=1 Tax=uncultured Dysosmobacter sp. TaxID=2591384 RepID=UPI0026391729|nr:hypothetical protein [uncultured Dysosmobacter sp.]